ncbi:MAG TPA: RNA chaperone Hfq [Candidatus Eremiobacteraeota bacterium]|mgnify:CR=1 FL=1|nr:MAG: RNA-binding protein Hfq [bacterium ADurb.Bin363]HPZ06511.1 RNA chaperone Hfq [Candidatus Eremiobacteraeota bacterium]
MCEEKLDNTKEEENEEEKLTTKFFKDIKEANKEIEIIFRDGEKCKGSIEWFDRWNIMISLSDKKECLIYRHAIKGYSAC